MSPRRLSRWVAASVVAFAIALAAAPPALKAAHLHWPSWLVALILASIVALGVVVKPLVDACTQAWAKRLTADIELNQRRRALIAEVQRRWREFCAGSPMLQTVRCSESTQPFRCHTQLIGRCHPIYHSTFLETLMLICGLGWTRVAMMVAYLLFVGPAATGKTRCAYQLLRNTVPDWRIFMPATASHIAEFFMHCI